MENRRAGFAIMLFAFLPATVVAACEEDGVDFPPDTSSNSASTSGSGGGTTTTNTGSSSVSSGTGGSATGSGGSGGGGAGTPNTTVNCTPAAAGAIPSLKLTSVLTGLDFPTLMKYAPGDTDRMFIVERKGKIKINNGGTITTFLDIESKVRSSNSQGDEQGLLGLAFHPDYATNGRFFVHYSDDANGGDTMIAEYKASSDPDVAETTETVILQVDQPAVQGSNHNGGSIEFSPTDGFLYIGLGDGGGGGDDEPGHTPTIGNSQDTTKLLGKILRIDIDSSTKPYGIPAGNLTGGGALPEIWDYGVRNPWRFSFDACNGNLYIGDVGQNAVEEIDVALAGAGNKNWGWRFVEGDVCYVGGCDMNGTTLPVATYDHSGNASVTGGYVYRGNAIPQLRGTYFYADYVTREVYSLRWDAGSLVTPAAAISITGSNAVAASSFGQDPAGEVYMVHLGGSLGQGALYRIDPE